LASRYGVSLQALKAANPEAAGGVRAGQKINIPK
jgi:LysM repeat protein